MCELRHVPRLQASRRSVRRRGEGTSAGHRRAFRVSRTYVFARSAPDAEYDRSLAWSALLLAAAGLVMVYSSSISTAEASRFTGYNPGWFLAPHAVFLSLALAAAICAFLLPVPAWPIA